MAHIRIKNYNSNTLYLYDKGIQHIEKTGGFNSNGYEFYNKSHVHRTSMNPTAYPLYFNIKSREYYACIMGTQKQIKLDGYKSLHILMNSNKTFYGDNMITIISSSKSLEYGYSQIKLWEYYNTDKTSITEVVYRINIKGNFYVVVLNENGGDYRDINIHKIWLDRREV